MRVYCFAICERSSSLGFRPYQYSTPPPPLPLPWKRSLNFFEKNPSTANAEELEWSKRPENKLTGPPLLCLFRFTRWNCFSDYRDVHAKISWELRQLATITSRKVITAAAINFKMVASRFVSVTEEVTYSIEGNAISKNEKDVIKFGVTILKRKIWSFADWMKKNLLNFRGDWLLISTRVTWTILTEWSPK